MGNDKVTVSCEPEWSRCVYHLFVVRVENRDELIKQLASTGIGTGIHYPIPLHLQNAYAGLGYKRGDFSHRRKSRCGDPLSAYVPASARGSAERGCKRTHEVVATEGPSLMEPKIA